MLVLGSGFALAKGVEVGSTYVCKSIHFSIMFIITYRRTGNFRGCKFSRLRDSMYYMNNSCIFFRGWNVLNVTYQFNFAH